jgi:hypothetical protein
MLFFKLKNLLFVSFVCCSTTPMSVCLSLLFNTSLGCAIFPLWQDLGGLYLSSLQICIGYFWFCLPFSSNKLQTLVLLYRYRLAFGPNEKLQLGALLSAFTHARTTLVAAAQWSDEQEMSVRARWKQQLMDCMSTGKQDFSGSHKELWFVFLKIITMSGTGVFFELWTFGYSAKWWRHVFWKTCIWSQQSFETSASALKWFPGMLCAKKSLWMYSWFQFVNSDGQINTKDVMGPAAIALTNELHPRLYL